MCYNGRSRFADSESDADGDELHDIEKLFIQVEYAWVFYTKAAAPRDAAHWQRRRAPGGRAADSEAPSQQGPSCYRSTDMRNM